MGLFRSGSGQRPVGLQRLACDARATIAAATAEGQGIAVAYAQWMAAIGYNGLSRYPEALEAARQASEDTFTIYISMWAMPELIEAAVRSGDTDPAAQVLEQLAEFTRAAGTDWALGIEARCRALLSRAETAEVLYREAIGRLGRTRLRPELARAHLLHGEWLRGEDRRADAREQLRAAHDMLAAMGAEAFAERARRELLATGEIVHQRTTMQVSALSSASARAVSCTRHCRPAPRIADRYDGPFGEKISAIPNGMWFCSPRRRAPGQATNA